MKVSVVLGTRPEAIKLAPVILALRQHENVQCHVCSTGQHRQMLDQVLDIFDIEPDVDLNLMIPNQSLASFTARAIDALDKYLNLEQPDLVLVQGDTTTVFCAALASFYHKVRVGHVEAGLRTGNLLSPWPEEGNRVLTTCLADYHFAPTETSRHNLLKEGVQDYKIYVTGNTVIDALFIALEKVKISPPYIEALPDFLQPSVEGPRMVLITGHRRENFGNGFENICRAIAQLALDFPDVHFVYPVHLNPNLRKTVESALGAVASFEEEGTLNNGNIHLIEPLNYLDFVALMNRSYLILTDSGGIQEEAPSLGKPVLVMRDTTERPEAVDSGTVKLVGANTESIVNNSSKLLNSPLAYEKMSRAHNPYGDGSASVRIVESIFK